MRTIFFQTQTKMTNFNIFNSYLCKCNVLYLNIKLTAFEKLSEDFFQILLRLVVSFSHLKIKTGGNTSPDKQ